MKNIQQALVLIKPDGLKKSLTGNVLTKFSEAKLIIVGAKVVRVTKELAEKHYEEHIGKPFFKGLIDYIQGKTFGGYPYDRVIAFVYSGPNAIKKLRKISGATNPEEAEPTSIRGSYGRITTKGVFENVVHCSSSPAAAEREIKLWFSPDELTERIYPTKEVIVKKQKRIVWA